MATVARIAENIVCPSPECAHRFNQVLYADKGWVCKCPQCGREFQRSASGSMRFYGNRRFSGDEAMSVTEGFRPYEVPLARKHITAGKIHDDGRVEFADRADQRKFMQQQADLQGRLHAMSDGDNFVAE